MSFSRRVLHMDPPPGPLRDKLADATGYPLPPLPLLQQANNPACH
jgi:hypothetical protein